jgi:hypothetical protein
MPIWLYLVTICVVVREIYCNACLWVRGAHLPVVSRGAILTILPVCGFAGLTCLWFHGVPFFAICLSVGSRGLPDCGFAGHFVLRFLVIEFLP